MPSYSLQPIEYVDVNRFVSLASWQVAHNSPATLTFILQISDALGVRRFVPPPGSLVKIAFVRSRAPSVGSSAQIISKTAVQLAPTEDKSLFKVDLTSADTAALITGGITLTVAISGVEFSFNIANVISKNMSQPGF